MIFHSGQTSALIVMVACLSVSPAMAGGDDGAGSRNQETAYTYHYFIDSDKVRVTSHYTDYALELENGTSFSVQWNNEQVLIPPVEGAPGSDEAADAITSASRPITDDGSAFEPYLKNRDVVTAGAAYAHSDAGYYVSIEEDYLAQQVSGSVNYDFKQQTINLSASTSYGWDVITPLADEEDYDGDNALDESESKSNMHVDVVLTAVLTPSTVVRIGAEVNEVRGIQHNSYRSVYAGGTGQPERHPDKRSRRDAFIKLNRYFQNRSSVNLSYKYYTDDWGVDSHTIGARLNQYLTRRVLVRYRYRYYTQGDAWFYQKEYTDQTGVDGYLSGDYRMDRFKAHLFGSRIDWVLADSVYRIPGATKPRIVCKYERYFNSNNFSANIFESGLAVSFP